MLRLRATTFLAAFALAACSGAVVPTAGPSSPTSGQPSPVPERSPMPATSVPEATPTALAASPSPEPLPNGRLVYGRFGPLGVTSFTSNTDGTDEREILPPPAEGASWAPNGLLLAVILFSPAGLLSTGTVKPDGSELVRFDSPDASLNLA